MSLSVHTVKCFPRVYKIDVQEGIPLQTLFDDVPRYEDLIYASLILAKTSLSLSKPVVNGCIDSLKQNHTEDCTWNREKGYAKRVVTVLQVLLSREV